MRMIDTHCHLGDKAFTRDREEVIERARKAGVSPVIIIGDSIEESRWNVEFSHQHTDVFCTVGVHPHHAKEWREKHLTTLRDLARGEKIVGIGEIGLDFHYDFSPRDVQQSVFQTQLVLAKEKNLPVVIHSREAIEETWKIIQEVKPENLVLHCCTERWEDAKRFIDAGYLLSFTGIITYKNAQEIRDTVKRCPLDRIMVETDSPYLAPLPHRGKRNEPAFVTEVARCIAEIKGISYEEVERATSENATEFFRLQA